MKPLQILITAVIRYGITIVLAFLVQHKIIQPDTLSTTDIAELVIYISVGLGVVGSAVYSRLRAHLGKLIALELPSGYTPQAVNAVVKQAPVTSVLAPTPDKAADAVTTAQVTGKI